MKTVLKTLGVALLSASLLSGCMGKFALTGKIYSWNKTVDHDRWINEAVFVAFLIVPVYSLSLLADGIIFNSVQWWTGRNPVVHAGEQKRVFGTDGSDALMTLRADGAIDVEVHSANGDVAQFTLRNEDGQVAVLDANGLPAGVGLL